MPGGIPGSIVVALQQSVDGDDGDGPYITVGPMIMRPTAARNLARQIIAAVDAAGQAA